VQRSIFVVFAKFRLGHVAIEIFCDGPQRAIQKFLVDIAENNLVPAPRQHVGNPIAHGAGADDSYSLNFHLWILSSTKPESLTLFEIDYSQAPDSETFSRLRGFDHVQRETTGGTDISLRQPRRRTKMNKVKMATLVLAMLAGTVGIASARDRGYYDGDDRYYDNDDYRYNGYDYAYDYGRGGYGYDNFRRGMQVARQTGFRDGVQTAQEDMWRGKRFNPNPRGRFDDADHGYNRAYGNKHEYREHYTEAYRRGYQRTYQNNGYGYGYNR
jgi:hypothetical protein